HASHQLYLSIHSGNAAIDVTELPALFFQHSDIRVLTNRKCSQLRPVNLLCRIYRRTPDDVLQRHAHCQKFGHDVVDAKDRIVSTDLHTGNYTVLSINNVIARNLDMTLLMLRTV